MTQLGFHPGIFDFQGCFYYLDTLILHPRLRIMQPSLTFMHLILATISLLFSPHWYLNFIFQVGKLKKYRISYKLHIIKYTAFPLLSCFDQLTGWPMGGQNSSEMSAILVTKYVSNQCQMTTGSHLVTGTKSKQSCEGVYIILSH